MDPIPSALQSAIQIRLRERHVHGLAICAFDADSLLFGDGVGYADVGRGEPVTTATTFRVASISKLLVTALLLRLVESGELDLDESFNTYLPLEKRIQGSDGQPSRSPLRTLLSHTSGLPSGVRGTDLGNSAASYLANVGRVRNLSDAISGLRLSHDAGEKIVYSNPAFNVAGFLAGRSLDVPFEEAAREHALGPLGMVDSRFASHRSGPGMATPYGSILPPKPGAKPADAMRLVATPMGGLTTNVTDLARFGQMVLNRGRHDGRAFLSNETIGVATSLEATNHPELDQGYGLGFKVRTWRGRRIIGHDGNMPGVATQLMLSPDDGVGVVVLTNGYPLSVPHEIATLALEDVLGLASEVVPGSPPPVSDADAPSWESFGRQIEGRYRLCDVSPPGVVGTLNDLATRIRVTHEARGRLRIDGNPGSDGPMWLQPDEVVGRYRVAAAVDSGTSAVVDEQPDGIHLWIGQTTHLHQRQNSEAAPWNRSSTSPR